MLRDITIENYRLFEKFQIEGLNQINLLVGANNSGKSSLLETLYLLTSYEDPAVLLNILENRGEYTQLPDYKGRLFQITEIFRGHKLQNNHKVVITSQRDEPISIEYTFFDYDDRSGPNIHKNEAVVGVTFKEREKDRSGFFELVNVDNGLAGGYHPVGMRLRVEINDRFVTTERLNLQLITELWNQVVLTPKEDMITKTLQILEPNLERIALTNQATLEMSVLLKIKGNDFPIILGSMGDGMYRIFALALSLVNCENGALFVDEIDTGLHHQALTKMWHLVIETAKRLNVQVFATTHSWDCLASFHKALNETEETDLGSVFRLERKNGQIGYVAYTGEELGVAVKHDIEMR